MIKIGTERLILKDLKPEDVSQDYVDWLNDPEINRYLSCAGIPQAIETCLDYVRSYERQSDRALIGIFLKENGLHIGNITLSTIDQQNKAAAIGISIGRRECMGKGLAREALSAIVKYCFEGLGSYRLWAGINVNNTKSLNLYLKCGFKIEELLRGSDNIKDESQDSYIVSVRHKNNE